jgi:hypothetical protein|tara:strand:+ start:1136 stop:1510 length:375 start_codon:yes stop_codon:yes gene_type:complete
MSKAYVERVWFSVIYKATGKKKCDCGWEVDAMNIVAMNPQELTYVRSDAHLMGEVIDVTPPPALPTNEVVKADGYSTSEEQLEPEYVHINDDPHDGWWLRPEHQDYQKSLPESDLEPFVPTMHD